MMSNSNSFYPFAKSKAQNKSVGICAKCSSNIPAGSPNYLSFKRVDGSIGWIHGACFVKMVHDKVVKVSKNYNKNIAEIELLASKCQDEDQLLSLSIRHRDLIDKKYQKGFMYDDSIIHRYLDDLKLFKRSFNEQETLETILDQIEISLWHKVEELLKTDKVWFENVSKLKSLIAVICDICIQNLSIRRGLFDQERIEKLKEKANYFKN